LKVLVIGNGAREHALAWKFARSSRVDSVYVAPGNAGSDAVAHNLDIPSSDIPGLLKKAAELKIDLAVIGPEAPLAAGIVDRFREKGIAVFGPSQKAARLEASKVFARDLMQKYSIPCAAGRSFTDYAEARKYLQAQPLPVVVKADGLAAGKGVTVAGDMAEAQDALKAMMKDRVFGAAGDRVIIEECLVGKEVSLLAFTDGRTVVPMVPACDYKRVLDNDKGPNTGGMGSYSPPGFFDGEMIQHVLQTIIQPVVKAMGEEGSAYSGVLYTGIIMTVQGPKVLEFNARFGDPETQAILPRLNTDLAGIMLAVVDGKLDQVKIEWSEDVCLGVVMASGGYPGPYKTGLPIKVSSNLDKDINIFYAGARKAADGQVVTDGGRVLTVTATGRTMKEAREKVYSNIPYVTFEGCHYRKDIAEREVL
jgi:phosphoribosylamine---glycine ligase